MKPRHISLAILMSLLPGLAAAADLCPPAGPDLPLPGGAEITFHQADVSTAGFPGQWQQGVYGPEKFPYRLFQNGSGAVAKNQRLRGWHVDFTCDMAARACTYASTDFPPASAVKAAKAIGDCLIATPPKPPAPQAEQPATPPEAQAAKPAAPQSPKPQAIPAAAPQAPKPPAPQAPNPPAPTGTQAPRPDAAQAPGAAKPAAPGSGAPARTAGAVAQDASKPGASQAACWIDQLPKEPAPARLQRLLLLAGFDPGRIDGKPGQHTRAALRAALGPKADPRAVDANIGRLRWMLCSRGAAAAHQAAPAATESGVAACD